MTRAASELPQLRQALMLAAERLAAHAHDHPTQTNERWPEPRRSPRWRPLRRSTARRGSIGLMFAVGLLMLAAVAYATTQLIQTGSPVKTHCLGSSTSKM